MVGDTDCIVDALAVTEGEASLQEDNDVRKRKERRKDVNISFFCVLRVAEALLGLTFCR